MVKCYCGCPIDVTEDMPTFPFHDAASQESWADKHYGKKGVTKKEGSIEFYTKRLVEMGKEVTDREKIKRGEAAQRQLI